MEEVKECNKCHEEKPLEDFYKLRKDREWRRSYCIDCHRRIDKRNKRKRESNIPTK